MSFNALLLDNTPVFSARIVPLELDTLPEGEVVLRVTHSCLNYKDALAITNHGPVVRAWPMVPGIDAAGVVETSLHPDFYAGDTVVVNGWGMGETRWGGLSQRLRVPGDWLVRIPAPFTPFEAAALGTAGYTAALSVQVLLRHGLDPATGPILVTGATGGVGSVAVMLLARAGFAVHALTGKPEQADYLRRLGASETRARADFTAPGKPLQKELFAGVVDTLGSHVLANACAQTQRNGAVAACGLAMGMDFPATVAPFILRGITLYGIDSPFVPSALRRDAWALLARYITPDDLRAITQTIALEAVADAADQLIKGRVTGRYVVDMQAP